MEVRIYYEDTDVAGVVYHANYLRYLERARTEFLRERGLSVAAMHDEGMIFPVVEMEISFKNPARLDDLLVVETAPVKVANSYFVLGQKIHRKQDGKLLVAAKVTLACIGENLRARRIPGQIKELFPALENA